MAGTDIETVAQKPVIAGDQWEFDWGNPKWQPMVGRTSEMVIGSGPTRMAAPGLAYGTSTDKRWAFTFASTTTASVPQGGWQYFIIFYDSTARHVAETGVITVIANPFGPDPVRPISKERKTYLDALKTFDELVSGQTEEVQFAGHRYRMWNILEFKEVLDRMKRDLDMREPDIDIGGGRGNRNLIYTKFRDV